MGTAYDEGPFQNFIAVGWSTAEPAQFEYADDDAQNTFIEWTLSESGEAERPVSQFQKIWPEGSQGSGGGADAYDFQSIPDIVTTAFLGSKIGFGQLPRTAATLLQSGPWYKAGGSLVANADRPARCYALKRLNVSTLWVYYGFIAVLPSLDQYYYDFDISNTASTIGISIQQQDNTTDAYSRTVAGSPPHSDAQSLAAANLLAGDINAGDGAKASASNPTSGTVLLKIWENTEGIGLKYSSLVGMALNSGPAEVSLGGLDVDYVGNEFETIDVIS